MSEGVVEVLESKPRVSNRRLLLIGAAVVVVLALVLGAGTVVDAVRGGAGSPQALARRLVSAVDDGRPDRAFALVEPRDRAAVRRLVGALQDDLTRLGLQDLLGGGGGPGPASALQGVDVSLSGVTARTEQISDDLAVLTFDTGRARVQVDPGRTRGVLRGYLEVRRSTAPVDRDVAVADLGAGQPGLRVVAVREDGRWYASLLLSLVDRELGPDAQRTTVTAPQPAAAAPGGGSDGPAQAAQALVDAGASAYVAGDATLVEPALDHEGAVAVALDGAAVADWFGHRRSAWRPTTTTLVSTALAPDRAVVRVEALTLAAGTRRVEVTPTCIVTATRRHCLHSSGYRFAGFGTASPFEALGRAAPGSNQRAFGMTAVREDGRWRIGLADSLADAVADWAGALTREQVLALAGRVRLDTPSGALTPGQPADVAFTSAGYVVRTLHIDRAGLYRFAPGPAGDNRGSLYAADGVPAPQKFFPNDDSYDLAAGDYTVVVWADDAFDAVLSGAKPGPYRQAVEIRPVGGS